MLGIIIETDHAKYRNEDDTVNENAVAEELRRLANRIETDGKVQRIVDTMGNESIHLNWEVK